MTRLSRGLAVGIAGLLLGGIAPITAAEPHFAVWKGLKCIACHTSPSGGGKRNAYGNIFAQTELPAYRLRDAADGYWTGELSKYIAVGADVRGSWVENDVPGQQSASDTEFDELLAYLEVRVFPERLSLHLDAKLLPDEPLERELYARLTTENGRFSLRGGQFFLPYGLRLQDDSAFVRTVPGINFNTPDIGWEAGLEHDDWSAQFAVTRGTAGGPEIDSGKQYSLRVSYVRPRWRFGGSANFNDTPFGDRRMQNLFAGLRTGRIAWLAEADLIVDEGTPTGRRESSVSYLEASVIVRQGHHLRLSFDFHDPDLDVSNDERNRLSLVWEFVPFEFVQTRVGFRHYDGIPQNPLQNREQLFAEIHLLF